MKKTPGGIYYHFKHEYRKWKSYDTKWDTMCTRQTFFVILGYFLPFYPHNSLKNENFKKKKKKKSWRYHHLTQVYQKSWS